MKTYSDEECFKVRCPYCDVLPKEKCIDIYGDECDIHPTRHAAVSNYYNKKNESLSDYLVKEKRPRGRPKKTEAEEDQ